MIDLHLFARDVPILPYTLNSQSVFRQLTAGRGNRSRNDLRIAAICIAHEVPLLTRNLADFDGLPGLTVHTW